MQPDVAPLRLVNVKGQRPGLDLPCREAPQPSPPTMAVGVEDSRGRPLRFLLTGIGLGGGAYSKDKSRFGGIIKEDVLL